MSYQRLNPKIIALSELPLEGREFTYSRSSGELNTIISDVIGANDYELKFSVKPLGNAFEMRGTYQTRLNLTCSRCAWDFQQPVTETFHEILVIEDARPRGSSSARANHASDLLESGPFANMLESDKFNVAEFFHELLALAEPIRPLGRDNCDDSCENYQNALREGWLNTDDPEAEKLHPFAALKTLKV